MDLFNIRKNYSKGSLEASDLNCTNPIYQVEKWLFEAEKEQCLEHSAIALSTVSEQGQPSSRMVLLKHIDEEGFYFFTNYESRKGTQLSKMPKASMLLFWPELERQIHIEGEVVQCNDALSDQYFESRPLESRISAIVSQQSKSIESKEDMLSLRESVKGTPIERPKYWGGYLLKPNRIEFWQGGENRFHDRIEMILNDNEWAVKRLMP